VSEKKKRGEKKREQRASSPSAWRPMAVREGEKGGEKRLKSTFSGLLAHLANRRQRSRRRGERKGEKKKGGGEDNREICCSMSERGGGFGCPISRPDGAKLSRVKEMGGGRREKSKRMPMLPGDYADVQSGGKRRRGGGTEAYFAVYTWVKTIGRGGRGKVEEETLAHFCLSEKRGGGELRKI